VQEEWPEDEAAQQQIRADFSSDEAVGDRRQELVFIGQVGAAAAAAEPRLQQRVIVAGGMHDTRKIAVSRREGGSSAELADTAGTWVACARQMPARLRLASSCLT
jgi:hypothetical protein